MSVERIFINWDRSQPALHRVADLLAERFAVDDTFWNLQDVVLVTPGARAGRRLLEILVERHDNRTLMPPRIVTLGTLPELLCKPAQPIASELETLLMQAFALQSIPQEELEPLLPQRPAADDFNQWVALAASLGSTFAALAADQVAIDSAIVTLEKAIPGFDDHARWRTLTTIAHRFDEALADIGKWDIHRARREAIAMDACKTEKPIILIACADLNRIQSDIIRAAAARSPGMITAMVHAPDSMADRFDAVGGLITGQWSTAPLDLVGEQIHIVDRPRDQAFEVLRLIEDLASDASTDSPRIRSADQITVGLGDESLGGIIQRSLELADVPAHAPQDQSAADAQPMLILRLLAQFFETRRFNHLADLLRLPDMERFVQVSLESQSSTSGADKHAARDEVGDFLTALDEYINATIQQTLSRHLAGKDDIRLPMKRISDCVLALVTPADHSPQQLASWADRVRAILQNIYLDRTFDQSRLDEAQTIAAFAAINDALEQFESIDDTYAHAQPLTFSQSIGLLERLVASAAMPVATHPSGAAVELLGVLELQLDDAPALIVAGMNEGAVPQSRTSDPLLPNTVRRHLGMADNERRLARDRMAFEAMIGSRPIVHLIAGRRGPEGDPLKPSRLLLMCEEQTLPHRVRSFYPSEHATEIETHPAVVLLRPGSESAFDFVMPDPRIKVPTRLHVTAFGQYIQCPYRFYLRYVLRLNSIGDDIVELDGGSFGSLAHEVLAAFGRSDVREATEANAIIAFCDDSLSTIAAKTFGSEPAAVIQIQLEQLRQRLKAFAFQQVQLNRDGWRILHQKIEQKHAAVLEVNDEPFQITGVIDRIDYHEREDRYRVIDYKTSDSPHSPEARHRKGPKGGPKEWIDLQLPLYDILARTAEIDGEIELGYLQLPKDLSKVGFDSADWRKDEIAGALDKAREIIAAIRRGVFWEPADPPPYDDGFGAICMDESMDRAEAIARASRLKGGATK